MAIHQHKGKTAKKYGIVNRSERIFNNHILACVNDGILKVIPKNSREGDVTRNQVEFLKEYQAAILPYYRNANGTYHSVPAFVYTDTRQSTLRIPYYITSGIPHSPLRELNDASQRERVGVKVLQFAKEIAHYRGYDHVYATFVTLTIPNVDVGKLMDGYQSVSKRASELVKALKDGTKNGNGLRLPDGSNGYAKFLGALLSIEITVNSKCLKDGNTHGIFHPHAHLLILTDRPLDDFRSEFILFDYWQAKHRKLKLSPDAFKLEPCHGKYNGIDMSRAVAEVSKYMLKPDFYKRFPVKPYTFSETIFAELFRVEKRAKAKRAYGILREACGFMSWIKSGYSFTYDDGDGHTHKVRKTLLSAVLAAGFKDMPYLVATEQVPAILTRGHVVDSDAGKFSKSWQLSSLEMLYANRGLLDGIGFAIPAGIKWPNSKKARLYHYLLNRMLFTSYGIDGVLKQVDDWMIIRRGKLAAITASLLKQGVKPKDVKKKSEYIGEKQSLSDLERLHHVLTGYAKANHHSSEITVPAYKEQYRRLALYCQMRAHNVTFRRDVSDFLVPIFDADGVTVDGETCPGKKSRDVERNLCEIFINYDMIQDTFIPQHILRDYVKWWVGRSDYIAETPVAFEKWNDDAAGRSNGNYHGTFSVDCSMTADEFQEWITNTLPNHIQANYSAFGNMFGNCNKPVTSDDDDDDTPVTDKDLKNLFV